MLNIILCKYKKYNAILCGDFNINLLNNNTTSKAFVELLLTFNFNQTIFKATRVTKYSSTLIDNIFINFEHLPYNSNIVLSALSDHHGQLITIDHHAKL